MNTKKRTENIVISLSEYKGLMWQAGMLSAIVNTAPPARDGVCEAVARELMGRNRIQGGDRK